MYKKKESQKAASNVLSEELQEKVNVLSVENNKLSARIESLEGHCRNLEDDVDILRRARERLHLVIDKVPALISYVDNKGRYVCCNDTYKDWFGISPKMIQGMTVCEVQGEEVYQQLADHFREVLIGNYQEVEAKFVHREFGERITHTVLVPDIDDDGEVCGYIQLSTDVTKERNLQRRNEEQVILLNTLMTHIPVGIILADLKDENIRMVSDYVTRLTGIDRRELTEFKMDDFASYLNFYSADGKTLVDTDKLPLARALLQGEEVVNEELFLEHRNGITKKIPILCNAGPIRDKDDRITGGIVVWRDISDIKAMDERLKQVLCILDETPDIVSMVDVDGRILYSNQAARQAMGVSKDADLTGYTSESYQPSWVRKIIRNVGIPTAISEGVWRGMTAVIPADTNREIPVSQILLSHKDDAGKVFHFSTIIRDVSERVQYEEQLEESLLQLGEANMELQQFAYACSHDFTEPLRTIGGFLDLFNRRYGSILDDKAIQFISQALQGTHRLEQLIADLLKYIRLDQKNKEFKKVDMNQLVDEIIQQLYNKINETHATIEHDKLPEVVADSSQMYLLLQNLITNALKFCRDAPPHIEISSSRSGNEWIFMVRDNGIGIDPRFDKRIFEVFQRLHAHNEYSGTGIGLSICQKIIKKHRGRIWFESEPGMGTTFYFSIPD